MFSNVFKDIFQNRIMKCGANLFNNQAKKINHIDILIFFYASINEISCMNSMNSGN